MSKISDIKVDYYKLPLIGNLVDALHGRHDYFEVVLATVITSEGTKGVGYTYTGGIGGIAIAKMLEIDLAPKMIGKELPRISKHFGYEEFRQMNLDMNNAIHYVARGGIASFVISALDIAIWDASLKEANLAIADVFGTRQSTVKTYHGGIDLMLTEKELLESLDVKLKEGHTRVKIKVGRENLVEDIDRVEAVRKLVGKDAWFAVDANMVMHPDTAIRFAQNIEKYDIAWFEEPTNPDKYKDYAKISENTIIPIAMGENLHTAYEHELAFDIGKVSEIIPDCSNVCGITGFFDVAHLAKVRGRNVNSHGMQELHVNVLGAVDNPGLVEYHSFPIYLYTNEPLIVKGGDLVPSKVPGTGVSFNFEKMEKEKQ
ncbi:mandelate racemase/muconate lactonizing enzyme family protein [Candidatus Epulonipiscium viviparus]|uniref:mandelate racemase/muconate lactonizing enzyme family protein n=1 Tax=Candidatus Epulonipiscium viviparus TaxID=420336 RepID=UPI0027381371|nr:mandelate racemase/muconate lactonizing enzyme family protein [Candidatus Epulopiscium viviparus]